MTEQIFVRNNRKGAALDDADESNLDLLVVVGGGSRFAVLHFVNDEVGTADSDPKGSGCGISFGSVGQKVGGVLTVEQFLVFDSVQHAPMTPGKAAGILTLSRDSATLDSSMMDGTYRAIERDRLPRALRQYTDKLGDADRAFRVNYPF